MYKLCKTEESTARQRSVEQALQQMMLTKRIENISVSELCMAAGIPRNSFYRYFDSCEDVLYALIDHTLLDINEDAFLHWNGNQNLELPDLEHYFEIWYHKREFLDALSKKWPLMASCRQNGAAEGQGKGYCIPAAEFCPGTDPIYSCLCCRCYHASLA